MKTLVIMSTLSFGGALVVYAIAVIALRRAQLRRLAADPFTRAMRLPRQSQVTR